MKALSIILSFGAVIGLLIAIGLVLRGPKSIEKVESIAKNKDISTPVKTKKHTKNILVKEKTSIKVDTKSDLPKLSEPSVNQTQPNDPPPTSQGFGNPQPFVQVEYYTPDSSVKFAVGDLLTVPEHEQQYIRYLSLYNIPQHRRRDVAAIVSFMVNSLSTRRRMYIPVFVGNSDETVIRLNIRDYEWNRDAWEKMAKNGSGPRPQSEPYFHTFKEDPVEETRKVKKKVKRRVKKTVYEKKQVPKQVWDRYTGRYKTTYEIKQVPKQVDQEVEDEIEVTEKFFGGKRKRTLMVAPWLEPESISTLMSLTRSASPIVRADWFIANASVPPAYYDFLRLGNTLKDFENLVFANEELAKKARSVDKGTVITSMVARNNRMLVRSPTFTNGYYWRSYDSLTSVNDRQYVQNILSEDFDATEDIGTLPNGLQAYFLANANEERIDFAEPDVAIDNTAVDRVVRTGRSCIICHADGIRPIDDEIRSLTRRLQDENQVKLLVAQERDFYEIQDLFGGDLDEQIVKDQNLYRAAVARSNGLDARVNARLFSEIYNNYAEKLLTKEDVCREVGVPMNEIDHYVKLSNDSIILGLIRQPTRPIRRDQWEFNYYRFMTLIMANKQGLKQIDEVPQGPLIPLEDLDNDK